MAGDPITERKLVAILAADVEGYSRLMGADEVGTLATLTAHRSLIDRLISEHRGRIANTAGDSVLVEFPSVVDAVQCAVDAQRGIAHASKETVPDRRLLFRIGVHVGDVLVRSGDLFGDGVNIAARLQSLSEPGGLCISALAHEYVRKVLPLAFADRGLQSVRNMDEPVRVYSVSLEEPPRSTSGTQKLTAFYDKPSIAVLPFANMTGDAGQDYIVDGLTEEIITALFRFRWFSVVGRNSCFAFKGRSVDNRQVARELSARYVLTGSVRQSGGSFRISAELADVQAASQIWAERYIRQAADIFALQDEISECVTGSLEPELLQHEASQSARRPAGDVSASNLVWRGMALFHRIIRESHITARELFRRAIEIDPELPDAHLWLGRVASGFEAYGWTDDPGHSLAEGYAAARHAAELDPRNPYTHYAVAITSIFSGEIDEAVAAAAASVETSPSFALGHLALGMARLFSGDAVGAIEPNRHGLRLSPHDPQLFAWFTNLAFACYFSGDHREAFRLAEEAARLRSSNKTTLELVALSAHALGKAEIARQSALHASKIEEPGRNVGWHLRRQQPHWAMRMDAELAKIRA